MFVKSLTLSILLITLYVPCKFHVALLMAGRPITNRGTDALAGVVSLYIADLDGSPYTADPIGVDQDGHTTWRVDIGAASGTFTATQGAGTPGTSSPFSSVPCRGYGTQLISSVSVTLVEGSTELHVFNEQQGKTARVDCTLAAPTASGAPVAASCAVQVADSSTTVVQNPPPVTLTPVPVQVSDGKSGTSGKTNGAGSSRLSLGGVAVPALAILGTAGAMLVRA